MERLYGSTDRSNLNEGDTNNTQSITKKLEHVGKIATSKTQQGKDAECDTTRWKERN
jgi:hypothetical protein